YAHGAVIHGLLSAETVMVNPAGRVKLTDFGVGRALTATEKFRAQLPASARACLAPELVRAPESADRRADVYALGVLLHELLTGQTTVDQGASELVPGLPPTLDAVIERCVAPTPADRFSDVSDLKRTLHATC